ncbi:hypothetical protein [Thioalkalivibrio sp. ALMg11]|uniref:hypothetical protein n=1 Tax=Thioalkalivibrio sp. ALMg11 TaxID=1158165 RepID=UPI00037564A8|nr:hypothetical protein [Thioalkalivibrio sp. ALMg11]
MQLGEKIVQKGINAVWLGLAMTALLVACGGERVSPVTLEQLAASAPAFDGEMVETEGVVNRFDDPEHYWLEDDDINRVSVTPGSAVRDHLGENLRVVGRFTYHPEEGRQIEIDAAATAALQASP